MHIIKWTEHQPNLRPEVGKQEIIPQMGYIYKKLKNNWVVMLPIIETLPAGVVHCTTPSYVLGCVVMCCCCVVMPAVIW